VHTDRAIDVVITLGQGFDVGRVIGTDADAQKMPDPALASGIESSIQEPSWAARSRRSRWQWESTSIKGRQLTSMSGKAGLEDSGQMDFDSTAGSVFTMVELYANPGGLVTPYR
jgi:hypothetical protein